MSSLETILSIINQAPSGLSPSQLQKLCPTLSKRTLQRRLAELVHTGRILATGKGRARRYLPLHLQEPSASYNDSDQFPPFIPLSPDSREILAYIDQPVSARKPVGYHREFLEDYVPGRTWYLSASLRRQLHAMGDSGQARLPAGTYGRVILNRLLIDLSWASSSLEGNTYTRLETQDLIEHGSPAEDRPPMETQMILNHKAAIELLVDNADIAGFNRYTVLNLHSLLSENLLPNPADEGRVRLHGVEIGRSVYRPSDVPGQLGELLDLILSTANGIPDPFEQSFFTMVHLPYLQPFADVNKRTSRLLANLPLIQNNLCPLTFLGVPEQAYTRAVLGVYELNRVELLRDLYVWAYERSTQEYLAVKRDLAEPDPLRLQYRSLIREAVREVVRRVGEDSVAIIEKSVAEKVAENEQGEVKSLIFEELRRLHEGVLARYGLRIAEYRAWVERQERWGAI